MGSFLDENTQERYMCAPCRWYHFDELTFLRWQLQSPDATLPPCAASGAWCCHWWVPQRTNCCQERREWGVRAANSSLVAVSRTGTGTSTQKLASSWNCYLGLSLNRSLVFQLSRGWHSCNLTNPAAWVGSWRAGAARAAFPAALGVWAVLLFLPSPRDFSLPSLEAGSCRH